MKHYYLNELSHLLPKIRIAMLEGRQRYEGQEIPVWVEDDNVKRSQIERVSVVQMRGVGISPRRRQERDADAAKKHLGLDL